MAGKKMAVRVLCFLALVSSATGLLMGAFNIQVFGKSKASKAHVMEVLVRILSRYDLVLIQEIRDSEGKAIVKLLDQVNEKNPGNEFSMQLSARLGRTSSKEQYAFFYRKASGLSVTDEYVFPDGADVFEREPYIVTFSSSKAAPESFTIAGIHVDPDDAVEEIANLSKVFDSIARDKQAENIMVMGDLNADCSYVPAYRWKEISLRGDGNYHWPIHDDMDTTVSGTNCAYDRFIYTGSGFVKGIKPGSARVFLFDDEYSLEPSVAKEVSDHYPIELELTSTISRAQLMTTPVLLLTAMLGLCLLICRGL